MCNCGCNTCETKKPALMLNESLAPRAILSEGLKHHLDANKPLTDHLYRAGSTAYFNLWSEARSYYSRGIIDITNEDDLSVLTETNLGHYGMFEGRKVPLDFPMLDEDIDNDIMLLEEGIMDLIKKGKEVTEEFLVKNIDPIVSKIIAAIKKGGDFVVNLLKKLFNVVEKYRKKYPTLFKVVILLILMVTTMIFSTAAQAADPGDLNYSADALNTMVGLLDKIPTDIDIADKMEAKVYLKDLQDGNLSGAYGEGAKNIASSIEVVYRDILQSAKDGDQGGMEILLQALETGKNTVMSALGVAINEAKKAKKKNTKKLNKPTRDSSGGKAYKVYVKDPKTGNIKTIRFGSGGLRAKINDKKARNAFAARHKCSTKKDKTKAGYWSCRLPRYAKLLGLKSNFSGFW
jgi:hypothetical protein